MGQGDKGTRGQGDKETRGQGDKGEENYSIKCSPFPFPNSAFRIPNSLWKQVLQNDNIVPDPIDESDFLLDTHDFKPEPLMKANAARIGG